VEEAEQDEQVFKDSFKTQLTATEAKIIDLIRKDPLITPEVIATTIGQSKALVTSKITSLEKRGLIETAELDVAWGDPITRRIITEPLRLPPTTIDDTPLSKIGIKYSYEGPQDDRNRPFCAKLLQLNRLYTRAEIERISARLGYSVWDRRGGFWTRKGTNHTTPWCRHKWKSNLVITKG
jgi:DNA-binding Lrp family transcriptional regulator